MVAFNKVVVAGNLTRDPELKYTSSGVAVCQFGLAINRRWKSATGEQKEDVTFLDCTAWKRTAELIAEYLKKGSPALVEGRLTQDRWEDKTTGQPRKKLYITVDLVQFLGSKTSSDEPAAPPPPTEPEQGPPPTAPVDIPDLDVPMF